jgi:hypothetical protein
MYKFFMGDGYDLFDWDLIPAKICQVGLDFRYGD